MTTLWVTSASVAPNPGNDVDETLTALTVLIIVGARAFRLGRVRHHLRRDCQRFEKRVGRFPITHTGAFCIVAADLTIVLPIAVTYAILKRHVIGVGFVISRT